MREVCETHCEMDDSAVKNNSDLHRGDDKPGFSGCNNSGSSPSLRRDAYFDSYASLDTHHLMVFDNERTRVYRDAILHNKHLFADAVVLDVGAGTGVLSLFAVEAGARHVYAVEASGAVSRLARAVVQHNQLEQRVTVLHGRVEDVELPVTAVDIIVSEWMGFYLLHEAMLSSVIVARDRFLRPGGLMMPDIAELFVCPSSVDALVADKLLCWRHVQQTWDMKPVADAVRDSWQQEPQVVSTRAEELLSEPQLVVRLELLHVDHMQLDELRCRRFVAITRNGIYRALCLWFRCQFTCGGRGGGHVLDTSPLAPPTHWRQTGVVLPRDFEVERGEVVGFELVLRRRGDALSDSTLQHDQQALDAACRQNGSVAGDSARQYAITVEMLDEDAEHPVPCDCGIGQCMLIKALIDKEQQDLDDEDVA